MNELYSAAVVGGPGPATPPSTQGGPDHRLPREENFFVLLWCPSGDPLALAAGTVDPNLPTISYHNHYIEQN